MPFITRFIASQMRTLPPLPDLDLRGRTYIVTGANSGIGFEIVRHLAVRHASTIILAVRNVSSGEHAMDTIYKELPSGHGVEMKVWHVDMSSFASVNHFADKCASLDRIDGVALNAGALGGKGYVKTRDGHEELTQVNVLAPVLLALLLTPLLRRTPGQVSGVAGPLLSPRIIFTGSAIAEMAPTKFFDVKDPLVGLDDERRYKPSTRYDESKLVLHSQISQLIKLVPDLVITDVNPGFVDTPLYRDSTGPAGSMVRRIGRTPEVGARNVSMALLTLTKSVEFYHDCRPCKLHVDWLGSADGIHFSENLWRESCDEFERIHPGVMQRAGL